MNARRVDRLFTMSAPDVVFPNPAQSSENRPLTNTFLHELDPDPLHAASSFAFDATHGMGEGQDPPLVEIFNYRNRSNVGIRKRLSENWKETEQALTQLLYNGLAASLCTCVSKDHVQVRLISLESWTVKGMDYCSCPLSTSCLIAEGFFPSTPRKPKTAFSLQLLRVLHEQSVRGSISKVAWADGLRASFEYDLKTSLPGLLRQVSLCPHIFLPRYNTYYTVQLRDTYHHWVAIESAKDTILYTHIELYQGEGSKSWQLESLRNLCPACFDIEPDEEDTRLITLDGNMQHTRFKDRSAWEFEELSPKLFVDYGRRQFDLADAERRKWDS